MSTDKVACPECGDEHHIYARADIRWNAEQQAWAIGDIEDQLECTECDASWSLSESNFPDVDIAS